MKRAPLKRKTPLKKRKAARSHHFPEPRTEEEQLDDLCRQIVLLRDQFACRWCGKGIVGGTRPVLQVHHIRTKGAHPALRWELENLILVCKGCHMFKIHGRDSEVAAEWYREHLGQAHLDRLSFLAKVRKGQRTDRAAVRKYLEGVLRTLAETPPIGSLPWVRS